MREKIRGLADHLRSHIRGQDHVLTKVCPHITRAELTPRKTERPKASFLFLGPTGVGKTQLTKCLSHYLFGQDLLFRFDMSEFLHLDNVKFLIGDETGQTGRLGKVLSAQSRGILLFDEFEKAHRLIWDLYLQMLDAGRITLADHHTYDLSEFYIICTSNIGSERLLRHSRLPYADLEKTMLIRLSRFMRPELIGRFSEIAVFKPLSLDTQIEIANMAIEDELAHLRQAGFTVIIDSKATEFLIRKGIHKTLGARPMRNTVEKFIGQAVGNAIVNNEHVFEGLVSVNEDHTALILLPLPSGVNGHLSA
ncbi:MAG TPA: AAA family ATPase [Terrimicrobiaceae bacterium]